MVNHILIVEDDRNLAINIKDSISHLSNLTANIVFMGEEGLSTIQNKSIDLILLDYKLPDMTAIDFLKRLQKQGIDTPVIILTAHESVERAVDCMKLGAADFIVKPCPSAQLIQRIKLVLDSHKLRRENRSFKKVIEWETPKLIGGKDPSMKVLLKKVEKIARGDSPILIMGETGTGKGVLANHIVSLSLRCDKPFVKVDCTGLTEDLLASDLFGHAKGAFTGAHQVKKGRIEIADEGTVFLDEIGDIPYSIQAKLLRIIEEKTFERVGETTTRSVDIRVIAATNAYLLARVEENKFRKDLYYRLNVFPIELPPLRERKRDIPLLCDYFLSQFHRMEMGELVLSEETQQFFLDYSWPGNVRELKNILERVVFFCEGNIITLEDLPENMFDVSHHQTTDNLKQQLNEFKMSHVKKILQEEFGDIHRTAKRLGIHPRYIYQILKENK